VTLIAGRGYARLERCPVTELQRLRKTHRVIKSPTFCNAPQTDPFTSKESSSVADSPFADLECHVP
jgi:hypothetical protein